MSLIGQQIDRYRLVRLLGSGGMGDVYLAEDAHIGQQVAIKIIRSEVNSYTDEHAVQKAIHIFQREAKAIVALDHPHILPLFDYGEQAIDDITVIYLVMPYRQEGSLAQWLNQRKPNGLLSPPEVAHIVQQAANALQHAHDHQIIHQDVKPANFLVRTHTEYPLRPDVLLTDFGIARLITTTSSASQSTRGTPTYMAPEQCLGQPVLASDQYALAVMAYELLTRRPPFQGAAMQVMYQHLHNQPQPPSTLNPHLPSDLDMVLLHGLAKKPEERFASITAFARAFQQASQSVQEVDIPTLLASKQTGHTMQEADIPTVMVPQRTGHTIQEADIPTLLIPPKTPSTNTPIPHNIHTPGEVMIVSNTSSEREPPLQRKAKRRPFLIAALALLAFLLLISGIIYAMPGRIDLFAQRQLGISSSQHLLKTSPTTQAQAASTFPTQHPLKTSPTTQAQPSSTPQGPNTATSARVTITAASTTLQHTYTLSAVTGTPNTAQQQVGARVLSSTTAPQSQTVHATGTGTIPATHASGTVAIDNFDTSAPITLTVGSVFANTYGTVNIHMVLDATVTVAPAPSTTTWSQQLAPGHILETGTIGNNEFNSNISGSVTWSVFNNPPFSNGADQQTYIEVQQSDIDGSANTLIAANKPDAQQVLQGQVRTNEQSIGSQQCTPNVTANHAAGDRATTVTVTVSFTCTGEVYDHDGALALASKLLSNQAATDPGTAYILTGVESTTLTSATLSNAANGTITLTVNVSGTWVFQLTNAQAQAWETAIAGKTKGDAQAFLSGQKGVATVDVQVSGGDGNTLPTDAGRITIVQSG